MTRRLFTLTATCMACGVAYRVIGVEINSNGTLREPFALIPIGYLADFKAAALSQTEINTKLI